MNSKMKGTVMSMKNQMSIDEMMRDPRYWRDKDPAFVAKVTEEFQRMCTEEQQDKISARANELIDEEMARRDIPKKVLEDALHEILDQVSEHTGPTVLMMIREIAKQALGEK